MSKPENWRPTADQKQLQARSNLLRNVREFMSSRKIMEVETPLISMAGNTDPHIQSIRTTGGGYLRTSPEFALKRLLAAGSGDVFELGRVFRESESGPSHNPEFTLLEWYRTGVSYHELMQEVAALVRHCGQGVFDHWPLHKLSYRQLFLEYLDLDPFTADQKCLAATAQKHGIDIIDLNRGQWLDLLLSLVIQPCLPETAMTFIYDYPANQAALARIRPETPPLAERFELYLGRIELANGYQELTDADEQERRFAAENLQRERHAIPGCPIDRRLLQAMEHGLPECAGVALGVDRLLMVIAGVETINEVIAFPFSRA